jgi:hypothetical protein
MHVIPAVWEAEPGELWSKAKDSIWNSYQQEKGWGCGSSSTVFAWEAQSPEFKLQYL